METAEDDLVFAERGRLAALGYRMLGTLADAEDVVQETFARWYRLSDAERAAIDNPAAWLTRVAGRICLDVLGSARARREQYVGPWLPEPLPADAVAARPPADPADRATLDDEVSTALLLVLESMTPAERVAFVLRSDGGGVVTAARNPIRGAEKVARFLIGVLAKNPGSLVAERRSGDGLTLVTTLDGRLRSVTTFGVRDDLITDLRVVLNPAKLTAWSAS